MSILVPFNGSSFIIPTPNEIGWGTNLDNYLVAIAQGTLQNIGGSFVLSNDADFGGSNGLKATYYKTRSVGIAQSGNFRLANASDSIAFRDFADAADLLLAVNTSDQLTFNGIPLAGAGVLTPNRAVISDGSGNVTSSAVTSTELGYLSGVTSAIQTQLNNKQSTTLTSGNILVGNGSNIATDTTMSGDVNINNTGVTTIQSAVVTGAKIASNTITNTNINAAAGIIYSKLSLTNSIVNADVNATAAIAITKLANGTSNQLFGTNNAGNGNEFKTLNGTTNQVNTANGVGSITLSLPQSIDTAATVQFGSLGLGAALDASAILSLVSTTKGFLPPVMTTGQKNAISSPTDGLIVYDSSLGQLYLRSVGTWTSLSTGGGSGTVSAGTAGRLSLYNTSTNVVQDTYVQNTKNITLAIATQASRSVDLALTIPNPGNAVTAANILLSEGAQTVNGQQTYTITPIVSLATSGGTALTFTNATGPQTSYIEQFGASTENDLAISTNRTWNFGGTGVSAQTGQAAAQLIMYSKNVDSGFQFKTTASNNTNPTLRMTIDKDGAIGLIGQVTASNASGNPIHGTNTNDSASAGYIGERVVSVGTQTNFPTSTQYGDYTSISLTAGDWDVSICGVLDSAGGATVTQLLAGVSTTSGNSGTGLVNGDSVVVFAGSFVTATQSFSWSIPAVRFSLSGTTTIYYKYRATYSGGTPQMEGRISARRMR